jgi:hypothetical protein
MSYRKILGYIVFHRFRQANFDYYAYVLNFKLKTKFATDQAASINGACLKSGQNWAKINNFAIHLDLNPWKNCYKMLVKLSPDSLGLFQLEWRAWDRCPTQTRLQALFAHHIWWEEKRDYVIGTFKYYVTLLSRGSQLFCLFRWPHWKQVGSMHLHGRQAACGLPEGFYPGLL